MQPAGVSKSLTRSAGRGGRQAVENLTAMAPPAWAEVIGE